jgi:hypothetical protein
MSLIQRDFYSTPTVQTVAWNQTAGAFMTSQRINGSFEQMSVKDAMVLDYHLAKHGFELWDGKDTVRERKLCMAAVSDPLPKQPDKTWKPLYTVPVWSSELGGMRELVIKGEAITAALADLFDDIESKVNAHQEEAIVPIISVTRADTEFGMAPVFHIEQWMPRPDKWPTPIVRL